MAAEKELEQLVKILKQIVEEIHGISSGLNDVSKKTDTLGKKAKKQAKEEERILSSQKKSITAFTKSLRKSITIIPDTLSKGFQSSFSTIGKFQNSIYLSSRRLREMNSRLHNVSLTQKLYEKQINKITKSTFLSIQESKNLYDQLNETFQGIKTSGTLKEIAKIETNMARLGLTAKETGKLMQQVGNAINFQQMRKALEGKAKKSDLEQLALAEQLGIISRSAFYTARAANTAGQSRDLSSNRRTSIREAERLQSIKNRQFAEHKAVTEENAAKFYLIAATRANEFGQKIAKVTSKLEVLSTVTGSISNIFSSLQNTISLSNFRGSGLKSAKNNSSGSSSSPIDKSLLVASMMGGTAGQIAGAALALKGDAIPVFVVGGNLKTSGFIPGINTVSKTAKNVAAGSIAAKALQKVGLGAAISTGAEVSSLGYGGKFMSGFKIGGSALSKKIPIIGALLSGGLEAFSGHYNKTENKIGAGVTTAASTLGGGWLGASIGGGIGTMILPGVGTAIGALIGGIGGGLLGDIGGSKISRALFDDQKQDKLSEKQKKLDDFTASSDSENEKMKETVKTSGDLISKLEEADVQLKLMSKSANALAGAVSSAVSAMSEFPALGSATSQQMKYQASLMSYQLKLLSQKDSILTKNLNKAIEEGDEKKIQAATMLLATNKSKEMETYYRQQLLLVKSIEKPFEDKIKLQQVSVDLASSELERNKALRLGIGINYKDQIRLVTELAKNVTLERQKGKALAEQAKKTDDIVVKKQLIMEANKAQSAALQAETKMLNEAKSMREGYLDALEEVVAGLGAYAKILPKQGKGNQFFADTPSLGRIASSKENAAQSSQEPIKYTMSGPNITDSITEGFKKGIEAYSKYNEKFLWKLQQTTEQMYSGAQNAQNGAVMGSQSINTKKLGSHGASNVPSFSSVGGYNGGYSAGGEVSGTSGNIQIPIRGGGGYKFERGKNNKKETLQQKIDRQYEKNQETAYIKAMTEHQKEYEKGKKRAYAKLNFQKITAPLKNSISVEFNKNKKNNTILKFIKDSTNKHADDFKNKFKQYIASSGRYFVNGTPYKSLKIKDSAFSNSDAIEQMEEFLAEISGKPDGKKYVHKKKLNILADKMKNDKTKKDFQQDELKYITLGGRINQKELWERTIEYRHVQSKDSAAKWFGRSIKNFKSTKNDNGVVKITIVFEQKATSGSKTESRRWTETYSKPITLPSGN